MDQTSSLSRRIPLWQHPAVIIGAGCIIAATTFGVRAIFGLFTVPVTEAYGWDREVFGLAMALQNLIWGAMQPVAGAMADKFGTARVIAAGAVIYALGVFLMPLSDTPTLFYLTSGVMVGVGISTASFAIVMTAFSRRVPPERRSWAFGIATAASSMGQFLFAPLGQAFISAYGWQTALVILSAIVLLCIPLAVPLRGKASDAVKSIQPETDLPMFKALARAFGHGSYILLVSGFFVCGFQIAFITTHMPPYLTEAGLAPSLAAWSIGMVGLFNIVGSYGAGVLGGRYSKPHLLSAIYFLRALAIVVFLIVPISAASALIFAAVMGLLWLSTVPPTAALVSVMFGTRYMGMLYGFVFLSHQVGSFLGVWLGGLLYDVYGTYVPVWWMSVALGLFAAVVHWPIREKPAASFAPAGAPA